jgi:hypothetical protein
MPTITCIFDANLTQGQRVGFARKQIFCPLWRIYNKVSKPGQRGKTGRPQTI